MLELPTNLLLVSTLHDVNCSRIYATRQTVMPFDAIVMALNETIFNQFREFGSQSMKAATFGYTRS